MLIICPSCETSYELDAAVLGAGRPVRCVRCKTVWTAGAELLPAMADGEDAAAGPTFDRADITGNAALADPDLWGIEDLAGDEQSGGTADPSQEGAGVAEQHDAPPLVPGAEDGEAAQPKPPVRSVLDADDDSKDIETLASRRMRIAREARARKRGLKLSLPLVILVLIAATAALLVGRERVVAWAPQSASLYAALGLPVNLRGLVFEDVRSTEEMHNNIPVLIISGTIRNVAGRTVEVPRLRFSLRKKDGVEVYAWTAQADNQLISHGESVPFRSQLASPPGEAHDIVVRFFNRRDLDVR